MHQHGVGVMVSVILTTDGLERLTAVLPRWIDHKFHEALIV
jgi:hypothetical protein